MKANFSNKQKNKGLFKRYLAIALSSFSLLSFVACGGGQGPAAEEDKTKTYVYVYNFDGGIGTQWLEDAARRFEKLYENVSFEDGKMGVKVDITPSKEAVDSVASSPYYVYFSENFKYNDFAAQNLLLDISDIVTSPLSQVPGCNETVTIEDKLFDEQKTALKAVGNKYYVLPHYECYPGVTYDADLFNEKSLFIKQGSGFTNKGGNLSVGPDGVKGTYDDGLPSSYEEFYALLDRMTKFNVEPFIYTGKYSTYTNNLVIGLWASYTGKEEFMLNVNFDSNLTGKEVTTEIITGFNGDVPVIERKSVTDENGYILSQQAGKYYGLTFLEKMLTNEKYVSSEVNGSISHLDAQTKYVFSKLEGNPIAMILEGSYWYNEAKNAIEASENQYPGKGLNRNFAFMPLPRQLTGQVQEGEGTKNTLLDVLSSYAFINARFKDNPVIVDVSKKFLQFVYTDSELLNFTKTTSVFKGVKYDVLDKDVENFSPYARNIYELRTASDVIHPVSDNKIFVNAQSNFAYAPTGDTWQINGYRYPYSAFTAAKNRKTAKEYFEALAISQSQWLASYSKYFD